MGYPAAGGEGSGVARILMHEVQLSLAAALGLGGQP